MLKAWLGRTLMSGKLRGLILDRLRREGLFLTKSFGPQTFAFTPGDFIGECLLANGEYQRDLAARAMEIVKPKTILEIGANIGTQTAYFFEFGAERVTAIEPAPVNLTLLDLNLRLNGLSDRVEVVRAAASSTSGTASFAQYVYNQGRSAIVRGEGDGAHNVISVPTVRIDDIVEERPDFIWMDVEEHEIEVLRGMPSLWGIPMLLEFGKNSMRDEDFAFFVDEVLPRYSRLRAFERDFRDIAPEDLGSRQYNLLLT